MTDQGTADDIIVCGPNCKALQQVMEEKQEERKTPWWETLLLIILSTVLGVCAIVGALDVGVRAALHYWHF